MKDRQSKVLSFLGILLAIMLLMGCSAQSKRKWLIFFFDGVPPEKSNVTNAVPVVTPPPAAEPNPQPAENKPPTQQEDEKSLGVPLGKGVSRIGVVVRPGWVSHLRFSTRSVPVTTDLDFIITPNPLKAVHEI